MSQTNDDQRRYESAYANLRIDRPHLPVDPPDRTWPEIQKFAVRMQGLMSETGWKHGDPLDLAGSINVPMLTLYEVMRDKCDPETVWAVAAEIANTALRAAESYDARYEAAIDDAEENTRWERL